MADFHELETRYEKIPQEMKSQRHWVCFKSMVRNGKKTKVPISPNSPEGTLQGAPSNDRNTWSDFAQALRFCAENDLDGLGFELGESGMFGVDISNHPDENGASMSEAEFQEMANDFVKSLNSYTEWSVSKNGIHILCYGTLPEGIRKTANIELYDNLRFFAMTGNAIGMRTVKNRTEEIRRLWKRYFNKEEEIPEQTESELSVDLGSSTDEEVMEAIGKCSQSQKILGLMAGSTEGYESREKAIFGLCSFLAYYAKCDEEQVDRLFRKSKLFDASWDAKEGGRTHGYFVVQNAVEACAVLHLSATNKLPKYVAPKPQVVNEMNLDADGEPIFRVSENYNKRGKKYTLDDTGNAKRFYDCFGENFHWDTKSKLFMFWTGKTWVYDNKEIVRKYANKLIELLSEEAQQMRQNIEMESDDGRRKTMTEVYKAFVGNVKHLSNKSGKDAMLSELHSIGSIPVEPTDFDKSDTKINTESGIVDLETGEVLPFDKAQMFASNTHIEVDFSEPVVWMNFLHQIFWRGDSEAAKKETEEIIECYQRSLGYTLSGLTDEQVMFLLHGDGSNGKSTQSNVVMTIMGDYFGSIDPSQLMMQKNQNAATVQYSLAELLNTRYLITQETDKGARLSESVIKQITGSTVINAQKKFGNPFKFMPRFKLWMETNNLPYISGKDYGIWRRIFLFTFKRQFKEEERDKDLPAKLEAEYPKILGWAIQGAVKYLREKDLKQPECLKRDLIDFKESFDGIVKFIASEGRPVGNAMVARNDMYMAYKNWAANNREHAYPESRFRDEMMAKGFKVETNERSGIQYYIGLRLNADVNTGSYQGPRHSRVNPLEEDD